MLAVILFCLGAIFGSFAGALVYRLKNKKDWVKARSQCETCFHTLSALDLVPIISWLWLRGRCRYCGQKIAGSNLLVEVVLGIVFAASYIFWPQTLAGEQWILFITWLAGAVGLAALALYDLKWMLLPNHILYPTFFIVLGGRLGYILFASSDKAHSFWLLALSLLVASGIFWLIYVVSRGKLIGYGDVRLGLILGTLLASPAKSLLMIFLASVLGTIVVLPSLAMGQKSLSAKLPFGPFLILATAVALLFGEHMINWYLGLLG